MIFKSGEKKDPRNYRGITLTSTLEKLFTYMLNKRLTAWSNKESILSEAQFAYRTGYNTTDAIFLLHSILSYTLLSSGAHIAFIDFSKAFDNVARDILYKQLKCYDLSNKMLKVIIAMYSNIKNNVRASEGNSASYCQCKGLMQGECLSPTLFSFFINDLEDRMNDIVDMGVTMNDTKISLSKYICG